MRNNTELKRKTNQKNKNPDLQKALKYVEIIWRDLSDQLACTQRSIANLRKDQEDAQITKKMLDYVLFGPER